MERGDILLPNDVENDVFRFDLDQSNRVSVSRSQCIIPNTDDMAMAYFVSPISTICFFFFDILHDDSCAQSTFIYKHSKAQTL